MRYALADLEVTEPLPTVALARDEVGIGVLVRRKGRPVEFFLRDLPAATVLGPDDLGRLVASESAEALVREAIREQIGEPGNATAPLRLTIAVCTHERADELETCLRSILATLARPDAGQHDVEVLVVDNAPASTATHDLAEGVDGVRYVVEPRAGLDFARNRALREARGDFVAYLDDDVRVDPDWLAGLAEAVAENPDAGAVTGLVLPAELVSEAQVVFERRGGFRRGFEKLRYQGDHRPGVPLYPTGAGIFGSGCNMVVRREAVAELGGFDEALDTGPPLPGGGDLDIFYRVVRAGHPLVYEPRMLAFHRHRREHAALRRQYWTWGEGFIAFVAKTYGSDPPMRPQLRKLGCWWFAHQAREVTKTLLGRSPLSPDLALAELAGGFVALTGTYGRSRRRSARIAAEHGAP